MSKYLVILIILVLILAANGCGGDKYENILGEYGNRPGITLEYPDCFEDISRCLFFHDSPALTIQYARPVERQQDVCESIDSGGFSGIAIIIHNYEDMSWLPDPLPEDWIETDLQVPIPGLGEPYCEELWSEEITVSGYQAKSEKYLTQNSVYNKTYIKRVYFCASFHYNYGIAVIRVECPEDEADEVEEYYNHLLETFQIIE